MKLFDLMVPVAAVVLFSGCALQKDLYSLETRQAQLERRTLRMEEQVGSSVKNQIDRVMEERQGDAKQVRAQYAALKAEVDSLRDEVNQLRGSIEEAQFKKSKQTDETDKTGKEEPEKVLLMTQDLEQVKRRLTQLELYLDLDQPDEDEKVADVGKMSADQAMYAAAKAHYDQGRMEQARKGFIELLKAYPKSSTADNAQFWIGETFYQQKWYEKAILEYQKVIENFPKGNKVPAALLKQAFAFQKIGDTSNAKLILKECSQKYPSSNEGKIAAQKLTEF